MRRYIVTAYIAIAGPVVGRRGPSPLTWAKG